MRYNNIESVLVGIGQGAILYRIGQDGITEIKDKSQEFPDATEFIFHVYKGDLLVYEIINQPVIVSRKQ